MNVHTRHTRLTSFEEAQEAFNRECHSDALREMQIVPAEQPIVGTGIGWVVPMAFVLGVALTIVGANSGASSSTNGALALRAEPASSLDASRFDHLAGDQ